MLRIKTVCHAAFLLAALPWIAEAQDWPQWRGPNRDGIVASFSEPRAWPEKLKMKWKVNVGEGHSSPVLSGGRVYVHTRQGEREVVSCLRPETGQAVWQQGYDAPYTINTAAARHGKGGKSTPVVADGRIYPLGINGTLSCFDAATGRPQWRKEFGSPAFGTAASPLVDHGLVIAYVGTSGQGALTAFDARTGVERWSWRGDGPAYASPIVADLGGTRQVVTQSQHNLIGVSAATGELLWRIPYSTPYEQNIVTPVLYHDTLIFSGLGNGVMGVRLLKHGSRWVPDTVWQNKDVGMYMSSPVVTGDLMFGLSHLKHGQFFCLDPRTGTVLWTSEGCQGDNAAIVSGGPVVFLLRSER